MQKSLNWFNFIYFYGFSKIAWRIAWHILYLYKSEAKHRLKLKFFVNDYNTVIHIPY